MILPQRSDPTQMLMLRATVRIQSKAAGLASTAGTRMSKHPKDSLTWIIT